MGAGQSAYNVLGVRTPEEMIGRKRAETLATKPEYAGISAGTLLRGGEELRREMSKEELIQMGRATAQVAAEERAKLNEQLNYQKEWDRQSDMRLAKLFEGILTPDQLRKVQASKNATGNVPIEVFKYVTKNDMDDLYTRMEKNLQEEYDYYTEKYKEEMKSEKSFPYPNNLLGFLWLKGVKYHLPP